MKTRTIVAVALVAASAGCGKSEQEKQAEQAAAAAQQVAQGAQAAGQATQQGAQQFAQGMQQIAQGLQQMSAAQGDVVSHEQLRTLLPETVGNWTRKSARSEQLSLPFKVSNAEARYENGAASLDLKITDASLNQLLIAPLSMFMVAGYEEKSDDGYKKYAAMGNVPGFEEWQQHDKRGEVTLIVGRRFVVQATGHNVESVEPVRAVLQALDLGKLSAIK